MWGGDSGEPRDAAAGAGVTTVMTENEPVGWGPWGNRAGRVGAGAGGPACAAAGAGEGES